MALQEPEIGSTDPNILIDNNCTDDELHLRMLEGSWDSEDEGDDSEDRDAIPTDSRRQPPATELDRFHLGISTGDRYDGENGDRYEGEDGDNADADEQQKASRADDGTTQNVGD